MDLRFGQFRHLKIDRLQRRSADAPGVLSLSGGLPAAETFPVRALANALASVGRDALQYDWPEGREELRKLIAARLSARSITVAADDILVTSGAQQALDIALQISTEPGSEVGVPGACYPMALSLFRARELEPHVYSARDTTQYCMPLVANPTGLALEPVERARLLLKASPILEDDAYGELRFGAPAPPLAAVVPERTFLIGTFSKTLCPGLRVGWLVAPKTYRELARRAKQLSDLQANTLTQAIVERYLTEEDFDERLAWLRTFYGRRADALIEAVRRRLPGVSFREPEGGFSLWLETQEPGDDADLLALSLRHGVSFDPGSDFLVGGSLGKICLRLTFSSLSPALMDEAVARLARALEEYRKRARAEARTNGVRAKPLS